MKEDCIYMQVDKATNLAACSYLGKLVSVNGPDDMCRVCRLWDGYIPKGSTPAQIEKAIKWMDGAFDGCSYEAYFGISETGNPDDV